MPARRGASIVAATALMAPLLFASVADAKGTAFVVGTGSNQVAPHTVAASGALSPVSAPVPTGNTPRSVAVTPNAKHAYVSNFGANTISAYEIASSGALSPLGGSPFATGVQPEGIAIVPGGQFLFVANQGGSSISAFEVGASGALAPVSGSPFAANQVQEVAVTADGRRLYATAGTGVLAYEIASSGALTPVPGSPFAAGTSPKGIATTPNGRYLYVSNTGSNNISAYSIGTAGGLTSLGTVATGTVPQTAAVSPDGRFLYVANFGSDTVTAYAIGADGSLSAVSGQPFPAGTQPYGVDAAPGSRHLYVSNFNNNNASPVSAYDVAGTGALSQIAGSPFASGVNGSEFQSIAITPNQGPTAAFNATPAAAGSASAFDASASSDSDGGTVARFDWDFGDGTVLADGGANPSHVYAEPGSYEVALTVTDDEGCSTTVVITGQTVDCNGGPAARAVQTVEVTGGSGPGLRLLGKRTQRLAKRLKVKVRVLEAANVRVRGKLLVTRAGGKKQRYRLKRAKRGLDAGKAVLKPRLSKRSLRVARRAFERRGRATARFKVRAVGSDGRKDVASRFVRLRRR